MAPDLLGYGRSERLAVPLDKDWHEDLRVAKALALHHAEPIDIVGHSYGGFLALQLALAMPYQIRRLALHEPVLWGALRSGGSRESCDGFDAVVDVLRAEPPGSLGWLKGFVDFWGGEGSWDRMPATHQRGWRVVGPLIAAEVIALTHDPTPHTAYAAVPANTLVTMGRDTPSFEREVCELLVEQMPNAGLLPTAGGHTAVVTHAAEVAQAHATHLQG
jgi:pimeloyl-ACP methyl ester carboxylesterase